MSNIVVTGCSGFIGQNLMSALGRLDMVQVYGHDIGGDEALLKQKLAGADLVYHLAGVNRPQDPREFDSGNYGFLKTVLDMLDESGNKPRIVVTSSIQAELDNPYGLSKRKAEEELHAFAERTGAEVFIYRLTNVFGKWSRPFYNSVIATFCHQCARGEPLRIDDPAKAIDFVYIDDVVAEFLKHLGSATPVAARAGTYTVEPVYRRTLGEVVALLENFRLSRQTSLLPDFTDGFSKKLYSTYLSFMPSENLAYDADRKSDERGYLFELLKGPAFGQIFVSRTLPGITRGNHYHHTKVEKFCVIEGQARIAFRNLVSQETTAFDVDGQECRIVDIPPGWTHNITNTGKCDLLTLFWANEPFDKNNPDTFFEIV